MADVLDFDSERTPPILYNVLDPQGISKDEWEQHFNVDNSNKIVLKEGGQKEIELFGMCDNSRIHRKVLKYIDWINVEIDNITSVTRNMSNQYKIVISPKVNNQIKSQGYTFADLRFNVNFKQVNRLLMGEQIYGSKRLGLRELVQNAIDACKTRKEIEDEVKEFGDEEYTPVIKIIFDANSNQVIISDNGTGMTLEILKKYLLNMGASFYTSDEFVLRNLKHKPIGNYGIGFLACFMLSNKVIVKTRHFQTANKYEVELLKEDEYVSIKENEDVTNPGTEIIMQYDEFMGVWDNDITKVKSFLERYFISDIVSIELIDKYHRSRINITNPLDREVSDAGNSSLLKIDLSKYLNEVEGHVYIKNPSNVIFSNAIADIPCQGDTYFFNGEELLDFEKANINILSLVENEELKVIEVPIIEDSDILDKMIEVLGDDDEAIEMYIDKQDPKYVSILAESEYINTAKEKIISRKDDIMDGLTFDDLCDFDQDINALTKVDIDKYRIFNSIGTKIFLLLGRKMQSRFDITDDMDVYVRGVYVKSLAFNMDNFIRNFKPDKFKVNINMEGVTPKISRNEFMVDIEKTIIASIYTAICLGIFESIRDYDKKETLISYLKKYYNNKNTITLINKHYASLLSQ
ncbi:ATP-binding protein [Paenibacillus sp. R14(2021)]|uniref:ATP-binding protein n=1 Tax=Paenibacillus sp. R14(2021) TaxID=2859228 RepID=UPI001C614A7A|nr:ATP-binding protein [Paenibacillus sp. R14(2021)]